MCVHSYATTKFNLNRCTRCKLSRIVITTSDFHLLAQVGLNSNGGSTRRDLFESSLRIMDYCDHGMGYLVFALHPQGFESKNDSFAVPPPRCGESPKTMHDAAESHAYLFSSSSRGSDFYFSSTCLSIFALLCHSN